MYTRMRRARDSNIDKRRKQMKIKNYMNKYGLQLSVYKYKILQSKSERDVFCKFEMPTEWKKNNKKAYMNDSRCGQKPNPLITHHFWNNLCLKLNVFFGESYL